LKEQIDSLSEGSTKGHIRTVVNIDSYVVNGTECAADTKDIKTKKAGTKVVPVTGEGEGEGEEEEETSEEVASDASESSDDEDTKEANKLIRLAK